MQRVTAQITNQFFKTNNNNIIAIPSLMSIQGQAVMKISSFSVISVLFLTNSNLITIGFLNDNSTSNIFEACLSVLLYHQTAALNDSFIAYSFSSLTLTIDSTTTRNNLNAAAAANFRIPFQYGPVFEPKCFIGLQAFLLDGSMRQSLNFNIS